MAGYPNLRQRLQDVRDRVDMLEQLLTGSPPVPLVVLVEERLARLEQIVDGLHEAVLAMRAPREIKS